MAIPGLKTVSLRGMGSAHTFHLCGWVRVGNVQSGQTDLGLLGLEKFDLVKVDYAQNKCAVLHCSVCIRSWQQCGWEILGEGRFF